MKKILAIGLCLLLLATACTKEDSETSNENTQTDGELVEQEVDNSEEVVEDDKEITVKEFISVRYDELSGGRMVVSPYNEINMEDMVLSEGVGRFGPYAIETYKTYDLIVEGNKAAALTVNILDSEGVILKGWTTSEPRIEESYTHMALSKEPVVIELISENGIEVDKLSFKRHIGEIVIGDEFDYSGLPDESIWSYEVGGHGWGNGELQYYTGGRLENAEVADGHLTITAIKEEMKDNGYSSTRIRTNESLLYGRVEVRAKLPFGYGTWPAIWMLPTTDRYGGWPNSGEIDIMEHVGYEMDIVHGSLHTGDFNFREGWHPTGEMIIPRVDSEFYTYTVEWTPYQMDMYIDDYLYMTYRNDGEGSGHWPYDGSFYLIMNIAVGGGWGGQQGIDESVFPQEMVVDYVRMYDLEDEVLDTIAPEAPKVSMVEVNGSIVTMNWDHAKDNYLVSYYNLWVDDELVGTTDRLSYTFEQLKDGQEYNISLAAVDIAGNESERVSQVVATEVINYLSVPSLIEVDEIFFNDAGQIAFDDNQVSYLQYLEDNESLIYAINPESTGLYQLQVSYNAKVFDGEIAILDMAGNELAHLILSKGCEAGTWCLLTTEAFELTGEEQLIKLQIIEGNFKLDSIQFMLAE